MSFATYETSAELGQPVELFEFLLGGVYYRYTSDVVDYVIDGNTYQAIAVERGVLTISKEDSSGDRVDVTMPADEAFPALYVNAVPGQRATFTLYRLHRNDPGQEKVIRFRGLVGGVTFPSNGDIAKLNIISTAAAQSRPMPRQTYMGLCNHMLYDGRCGIDETSGAWKKTFTVTAVSGATITCPGAGTLGADFFESGFVKFGTDYRLVVKQATDVLTLQTPFTLSPLNKVVAVNAGCKHRLVEDCQNKFNNVLQFGGFPWVPLKNPFESGV